MLMRESRTQGRHAFLSYVREDLDKVDRLQQGFETAGIAVWRDTRDLWPGEDWQMKIRQAITDNAIAFIACFSHNSLAREETYQNEELTLAIQQLRLRKPGTPWLIPVRFDDCSIPDIEIGGGRTLTSLQRVDLFGEQYDEAALRLAEAVTRIIGIHSPTQLEAASKRPAVRPEPFKGEVLLSPEAAIDLQNIDPDERLIISLALEQISQGDSSVEILAASQTSIPYRIFRSHDYQIIFRRTGPPSDDATATGKSGGILVARIIHQRSAGDLSDAVSRMLSQAEPNFLPGDPLTNRWQHTTDGFNELTKRLKR